MTPMLQIDGLCKRFGRRQVLDGFSLHVAPGEIIGLLGPNGCGKSTALNIVCQLLDADAGQVRLMGESLGRHSRSHIGLCAQDSALYPDLLPAENLDFFARLYGVPAEQRRARVADLMERFGRMRPPAWAACRAAGSSGCTWRWRWCTAPSCWCWTNPRPPSTWRRGWICGC
jgi:ABC-type multidrug transport system ATPase subunit